MAQENDVYLVAVATLLLAAVDCPGVKTCITPRSKLKKLVRCIIPCGDDHKQSKIATQHINRRAPPCNRNQKRCAVSKIGRSDKNLCLKS